MECQRKLLYATGATFNFQFMAKIRDKLINVFKIFLIIKKTNITILIHVHTHTHNHIRTVYQIFAHIVIYIHFLG